MREVIGAQREVLLEIRNTGTITDEVMRKVEFDLDLEETGSAGRASDALRLRASFSAVEAAVFGALLVFWLGGLDDHTTMVLGWTHGIGFLGLAAVMYVACLRRVLPWGVLASAVLLTPIGSTIHIELLERRRRTASEPG